MFNHPTGPLRDSDKGPGPFPPRWLSLTDVNRNRWAYGLDPLPSSRELTAILMANGFTDCEGTPYLRVVPVFTGADEEEEDEAVVATSEAEVLVA